jgi:prophage antirepressor-like protein
MSNESIIQVFEGKNVRIVWNEQEEKYYFAVADIVEVLTDTTNPTDYLKKMRQRDKELAKGWGQIVTPLSYQTLGGKQKINFADLEGIFRIIQSIPSKKAEPVKRWLAEVGAQRIDQMIDPELTFQMAVEDYRRQGYSDRWINERMKSIKMRKELTDEWERSGIHEQKDFAILTNILTKAWSGMTTGEYKQYKGLTKENLRDNMTNVELALNTLAEVATTEISRQRNPKGFDESRQTAQAGGRITLLLSRTSKPKNYPRKLQLTTE